MTRGVVVVIGGAGWAGSALVPMLRLRGEHVVAPRSSELDVRDAAAVRKAIRHHAPRAVVNLAAAQPSANDEALRRVNVDGAANIAAAAAEAEVRLVHVSSDVVFDGRHAPYSDDAPLSPITPYGRSKADGETAVLTAHRDAVSVRTSLLWDLQAVGRGTARFAERLASGEPCPLFTDEIRCPLERGVLAECLIRLVDLPVRGPLNVVGREALSRHEFGMLLLTHFDVPGRERVEAVRAADLEAAGGAPRPRDLRLTINRAERLLGLRLPGVRELLEQDTAA